MNPLLANINAAYSTHTVNLGPWLPIGIGLGILGMILGMALVVGILALKGYALWTAAKRDEVGWFVALLIVNTLGILELVYLTFVAKKWGKRKHHQ